MSQFIGVLAFVVALLFSVMVHEFGHYLTAKHYGMKVTEFFLGFGKKIWSFTRGETEFGLKSIPAGGYCRIVGMSVDEELSPEEEPRAFIAASVPKRLVVLGAGSFTHFVLGIFLIFAIFFGIGTSAITPVVESVLPCVSATSSTCPAGSTPSPAKSAGLEPGDRIISINGKKVTNWGSDVLTIRSSINKPVVLVLLRHHQRITITAVPQTITEDGKEIALLGFTSKVGLVREPLTMSISDTYHLSGNLFKTSFTSLISLPTKVPSLFRATFLGAKRDPNGLVGVVGVAQASAQTASDNSLGIGDKLATFFLIIASLNIFVGIFNLFPLLPLDGGHMAVAIADGLRFWWARKRGRAKPAPINLNVLTPITIVVFGLLAVLSLMLLAADIFNPVHFNL